MRTKRGGHNHSGLFFGLAAMMVFFIACDIAPSEVSAVMNSIHIETEREWLGKEKRAYSVSVRKLSLSGFILLA